MTDTCEEDCYEEEPINLKSEVKAVLKVLEINKP